MGEVTEFNDLPDGFPSIDDAVEVRWAPVTLCPATGSPEKLVIAVVAVSETEICVETANTMKRLECLYGASAKYIENICMSALKELKEDLVSGERNELRRGYLKSPNICIEEISVMEGTSAASIAKLWLASISSLHTATKTLTSVLKLDSAAYTISPFVEKKDEGEEFAKEILGVVQVRNARLIKYFNPRMFLSPQKLANDVAAVKIDYNGEGLVANIGNLQGKINERLVDLLKRKILDLDIQREASRGAGPIQRHDLIIHSPPIVRGRGRNKRIPFINDIVGELKEQSARREISVIDVKSPAEIGIHIVDAEAKNERRALQ